MPLAEVFDRKLKKSPVNITVKNLIKFKTPFNSMPNDILSYSLYYRRLIKKT